MSNSYATGNVTTTASTTYAGGLIGYNGSSTVSNSYATGNVTTTASTTYAGGLIGGNYGTWSDSFFLDSTSDNGEGTQVSSTQLRDIATFITAGWSIAAGWSSSGSPVWGICGPANNGYPFLNPTVTTNPCAGTAARVEFTYYLPDGRECTNISPSYVILHAQIALPDADADCRTTAGSSIIGWTIPTPRTFTGIGSPQMPFEPGALVNVIDSQQFTAVLREPIQQYDYDSNLDTTTSCTQTLTSHVTQDGRVHHIWVPRADIRFARFPLTAACTPQGHRLIAWNTNGDGTGTTYTRGDPLPTDWATANFNTRTLYAIWGVG